MTLSLLSNSSDRFHVALASPPCAARTYRERLLDGSWVESNRRAGTVADGTALRFPARPRSERRLPQSDADWRCRQVGGCPDVGRLHGSSGAHRDGPADG